MRVPLFEKKTKESALPQGSLQLISAFPEFRTQEELVDKLKGELNRISKEKTAAIHRLNTWRQPRVEVIAEQYMTGADSVDIAARPYLGKVLDDLNLKINALTLAIQEAEKKLESIRHKLSAVTADEQRPIVRMARRRVLAAMLQLQAANSDIAAINEERLLLGYNVAFSPAGLSPWPYWGDPKQENSVWRMILNEFLDAGDISPVEHHRIINGVPSFDPED